MTVFVAILLLELIIFFAAMAIPLAPSQQQSLYKEGQDLVNSVNGGGPLDMFSGIFLNNVRIALIEAIPVVGPAFLAFSIYYTGQVLQAFAVSSNPPLPPLLLGAVTFVFPHALIEFAGYAIAVMAGSMLVWAGVKRRLGSEIKIFAQEIFIAVVVLVIAAATETFEIVSPEFGLVLWIPIVLLLVALFLWFKRVRRGAGLYPAQPAMP